MSDFGQSIAGSRGTPRVKPGVKADTASKSAASNRRAVSKMSELEMSTGHDETWWAAWHRENHERVNRRWGKRAA